MYGENCFKSSKMEELCLQKRFFFTMQACVAAHIAANYPQDDGFTIGFNFECFDHPYVSQLFFSFQRTVGTILKELRIFISPMLFC